MNEFKNKIATAGNKGPDVRSDCHVEIELTENGGIQLEIHSKVEALYGNAIRKLLIGILDHYNINNARLELQDSGALDFIIAARMEAAVRKLTGSEKEYLLEIIPENNYHTEKERNRFSRLYLPGNFAS